MRARAGGRPSARCPMGVAWCSLMQATLVGGTIHHAGTDGMQPMMAGTAHNIAHGAATPRRRDVVSGLQSGCHPPACMSRRAGEL